MHPGVKVGCILLCPGCIFGGWGAFSGSGVHYRRNFKTSFVFSTRPMDTILLSIISAGVLIMPYSMILAISVCTRSLPRSLFQQPLLLLPPAGSHICNIRHLGQFDSVLQHYRFSAICDFVRFHFSSPPSSVSFQMNHDTYPGYQSAL